MSKRNSPESDGGEGSSRKRPREEEGELPVTGTVRARSEAIEQRLLEMRAEDARSPQLKDHRSSIEEAAEPTVPASAFMKLKEENERNKKDLSEVRETLEETQKEMTELKAALENLANVLEAERLEKESLVNRLREMEQLQVENAEPEAEQQEDIFLPVIAELPVEDEDEFMDMDDFLDAADLNAGKLVDAEVQVDAAVLVDAAVQVDPPVQQQPQPQRRQRRGAANALRAMFIAINPPPRPQNIGDQLEDFYEELTVGANHPKIGKAIFKRVTSQFLGRNDYPHLRIAPNPVFDMNARNLLNQHFSLAKSLAVMCKRKTVMDKDIVKARSILAGNF